jgi:pimeloyl-ACP methyl ester carboxylesterase
MGSIFSSPCDDQSQTTTLKSQYSEDNNSITCNSIDNTLHQLMFMPPDINDNLVSKIQNDPNVILTSIDTKLSDIKISYLKFNVKSNTKKFIVFSHGNAATIFHYYDYAKKLCADLNVGGIFYDYPGYGLSSGIPTDSNCVWALAKVIEHMIVKMKIPIENIILIGQSIGTGVTMQYAYENAWPGPIILISPYKSIITVGTEISSCITQYVDKYPSIKYIAELDCPVKIFHGTNDNIIPISHGQALATARKNKAFYPTWLLNIGHNDILENIKIEDLQAVINYPN